MLAADPPDCSEPSNVPAVDVVIVPGDDNVSVQLLSSVAFSVTLVAAAGAAAATEMKAARPRKKRIGGLPIRRMKRELGDKRDRVSDRSNRRSGLRKEPASSSCAILVQSARLM